MKIVKTIWHNFKTQPDVWFFYGFLITLTLSIRKVLFSYPIGGQFNEYSGIYLYLSDIFLFLTIVSWGTSILQNKNDILSTPLETSDAKNKINLCYIFLTGSSYKLKNKFLFFTPLLLVAWSFISVGWADNKSIALFRSIKSLEFFLLYIYVIFNVPLQKECSMWNILRGRHRTIQSFSLFFKGRIKEGFLQLKTETKIPLNPPFAKGETESVLRGTILKNIFQIIIFIGLFQSIIGIWQFIVQKSIGIFWLKESLISPEIPGVAKIILGGEKFIRSYGLFPHPNILGGFLLISIIFTFIYYRIFHPSQNVPQGTSDGTSVEQPQPLSPFYKGRAGEGFLLITLIIQFIALLLTFSKSAILGLLIAVIYITYKIVPPQKECSTPEGIFHPRRNVPHGTSYGAGMEHSTGQAWNILRGRHGTYILFHVKQYWKQIVIFLLITIITINWIKLDKDTFLMKSWKEREVYINVSRETFSANPLIGVGSGQFVFNMHNYAKQKLELWQYQPVHSVYLSILNELGIIGLVLFLWFLWKMLYIRSREDYLTNIFKNVLIGFIFIMLFDHYLWDIQQGQALFWMASGLLVGINFSENYKE